MLSIKLVSIPLNRVNVFQLLVEWLTDKGVAVSIPLNRVNVFQ